MPLAALPPGRACSRSSTKSVLFSALTPWRLQRPPHVEFGETHVFVGPRFVVSVRHGSLQSHVGLRARCEASKHLLAKAPGFVLYALMESIKNQVLDERLEETFVTGIHTSGQNLKNEIKQAGLKHPLFYALHIPKAFLKPGAFHLQQIQSINVA